MRNWVISNIMKDGINKFIRLSLGTLAFGVALQAGATSITFSTPAGATESGGNAVNATATFTTGAGVLDITLTDLQTNPLTVAQLLSDLDFTLSGGQTTGLLMSSSGQRITVNSNGTFTLGTTGSTGWGLNQNVAGGLQLDALGFIGPAGLIIGPPGAGGTYSTANSSIAGNGPHNPFLNQTATFEISIAGLTVADTVTGATFSFGTTPGDNVAAVPEPATLGLLSIGLAGIGFMRRRKAA